MNNSGGETFLIRSSLNNNNSNISSSSNYNQQIAAELNQNQTDDEVDYHLLNRANSNNADQFMNRESSSVYQDQDQGTEIEIEIEQQQQQHHHKPLTLMNRNSETSSPTQNGGFRGSLKRLFSDKST